MKKTYSILAFVQILVFNFCFAQQQNRPIGINLSFVTDYSTELVFRNTFKQCRSWITANANNSGAWNTNVSIPLRPDGYPVQIPYNNGVNLPQIVRTLLLWDLGSATPTGRFRLKSNGVGQIRLASGASGIYNSPIDTLVNVTGGVILEIINSSVNNPIHDIQFILPQYINNYQNQTFTNEFLRFINDYKVIRFLNFTRTNDSRVVNWSDRNTYNYYTQSMGNGASWEHVIELANQTHKDVWINIPHQANDAYIDSLARLLERTLNPKLKIYLEYSNEMWNGIFSQHQYAAQMGLSLGYSGQSWERVTRFTAKRSADVFRIFENVFNNNNRLVKVLASQAANSWLCNQLISNFQNPVNNPTQVAANALAIAPYFGGSVANNVVSYNILNSITPTQIADSARANLVQSYQMMNSCRNVANAYNLNLICYEGGQHLVATGNNVNNDLLTQKLIEANRTSTMGLAYSDYLNYWYNNVGGLFCLYSSVRPPSRHGSWGLIEHYNDTLNPKYQSVRQTVFQANRSSTNNNADSCTMQRFAPDLHTLPFSNVTTTNVVYGVNNTINVARVYSPQGDVNTCRPVIIWAHGGGFYTGSYLEQKTTDMMTVFARKGYVAITMRYRLASTQPTTNAQYQDALIKGVQDMIAAIKYVRANAATLGIDTSQIFIGGSSAGAIIANHTAFMSEAQAFATALANNGGNYNVSTLIANRSLSQNIAGCITQAGSLWDLNFLVGKNIPWGAVHNTTDPTVPHNSGGGSLQIFNQLQTQGTTSFLKLTNSPGLHTPFPSTPTASFVDTFNLASFIQINSMLKHKRDNTITLSGNTLTAPPNRLSYQWFLNDVEINGATNSTYTATVIGNYKVVTKNCTNCFSTSNTILVSEIISNNLSISGPASVCVNSSIILSANISGGTWINRGRYTLINNGNGTATITGTNAGTTQIEYRLNGTTTTKSLNVFALPNTPNIAYASGGTNPQSTNVPGAFCRNRNFNLAGFPSGGVWSSTGVISVNSNGNVSIGNNLGLGSITYRITNSNGCINSRTISGNVVACASRGIETVEKSILFNIYPNPAKNIVNIKINNLIGEGKAVLVDMLGKPIKQINLTLGTNKIETMGLSKGMYMLNIITGNTVKTEKVIIE